VLFAVESWKVEIFDFGGLADEIRDKNPPEGGMSYMVRVVERVRADGGGGKGGASDRSESPGTGRTAAGVCSQPWELEVFLVGERHQRGGEAALKLYGGQGNSRGCFER